MFKFWLLEIMRCLYFLLGWIIVVNTLAYPVSGSWKLNLKIRADLTVVKETYLAKRLGEKEYALIFWNVQNDNKIKYPKSGFSSYKKLYTLIAIARIVFVLF